MRIHYLKLVNMTHSLSLCVFVAFKGTNFYTLFAISANDLLEWVDTTVTWTFRKRGLKVINQFLCVCACLDL